MSEDEPMAYDKLQAIREWLDYVSEELEQERISYGELAQIDLVYEDIKVWRAE